MKKFTYLFFLPFLTAVMCEPEDDCPGSHLNHIENENIVTIDAPANPHVGDTLWVNAAVNKNQTDISGNPVDLFSTDNKLALDADFQRVSAFSQYFQVILSQSHLVVEKGEAQSNTFIMNKQENDFAFRIGIKLLESGQFRLGTYGIYSYRQNFNCGDEQTMIRAKIAGSDENGFYEFTVE